MKRLTLLAFLVVAHLTGVAASSLQSPAPASARARWSEQQANDWYTQQAWLVGANYIPANAINELEMWQAETFDTGQIDKELGWAESIGMNTMRVFLHDLLWKQDSKGYQARIDAFLSIADKHKIKPMLVLFDSCWDPFPQLGKQRDPKPGVHNSGWLQSPGADALKDPKSYPRLEAYVKGVVGAFANDQRILAWDVWNEPDNTNDSSYGKQEPPNKQTLVLALLPQAFAWARAAKPTQPLTSGVWRGDWSSDDKLSEMAKIQIAESDVISFHNYDSAQEFEKRIVWLQRYKRPLICTEYLARGNKSTFEGSLSLAKKYNVGAINWGLVDGKTQCRLPWDSWKQPYVGREPPIWHHEIFKTDGTPYKAEEVALIRQLTGRGKSAGAAE
jgi:Glycosyl hydrolase family 10